MLHSFFFVCFDFNVIGPACFQMNLNMTTLLLCFCPHGLVKTISKKLLFFLYLAQESHCEFVYVCMCAHLIMAFAPEVAFVDHSAPAALNRR